MNKIQNFKQKHPEIFEFIMFNILANIATITNFAVLNLGNGLLFTLFRGVAFNFWVFDYSFENGGLCGFLSFLLSYACAQTVNFIVQRKLVFVSNKKLGLNVAVYIFTVIALYFICLYVPTLVMQPLTSKFGNIWAANISNALNILIQVIVMYPVLKFIVMKKDKTGQYINKRNIDNQVFNPFLPGYEYIPDGEPRIFNNRLYIYGSHDRFNAGVFCVNDYVCWSAPVDNLSDFRYEGIIYNKKQDPLNKTGLRLLFAPDIILAPDGKCYMFYSLDFSGIMSVAVCDTPAGQFKFHGHVRFADGHVWGTRKNEPFPFDPGVFIDDDNKIYLYSGFTVKIPAIATRMKNLKNDGAVVFELENDMLTIKSGPNLILSRISGLDSSYYGHEFFEASSMRKINNKYYFIYSSKQNHELCYAISDYPDRGFTFAGTLVSIGDIGLDGVKNEKHAKNYLGNTHGSIIKINNDWYVFYHRQTNRHSFSRQACADRLEISDDGHFKQTEVTSCGLNNGPLKGDGKYNANIACNLWSKNGTGRYDKIFSKLKFKAHPYFTQNEKDGNYKDEKQFIANMRDGSAAGFKYFNLNNADRITVDIRGNANGEFFAAADSDLNNCIACIPVKINSQSFCALSADCRAVSGVHPLYFQFKGKGKLDFFAFEFIKSKN